MWSRSSERLEAALPARLPSCLAAAVAAAVLAGCGGGGRVDAVAGSAAAGDSAHPGAVRRGALAAPTRLAVSVSAASDPLFDGLAIPADAPTKGLWSGVKPWPMNAIHLALGPDASVLSYGSLPGSPDVVGSRAFDRWTPSLGFGVNAHQTTVANTAAESFCSSATPLASGNLMVVGGVASRESAFARWGSREVVDTGVQMANDRWYPTATTLADGRVVVVGGMDINSEGVLLDTPDLAIANGIVSMTPELYTPGAGWRTLVGAISRPAFGPDQVRASYPKSWLAPNGRVFGISVDTMWSLDVDANGGAGSTTVLGTFKTPYGRAIPANVGTTATAVMYAPGRILQAGGNGGVAAEAIPGANAATLFDINGPSPQVQETAPMTERRRMANSVVLPNGRVLVTGGSRFANQGGAQAVFAAEIWNSATGSWTTGASAAVDRVYHATALLLANGAVLSAGGNGEVVSNENAEIYYPPYLFRSVNGVAGLAPRPVVTGVNALAFGHGGAVQLELAGGQLAQRLVLIRAGTVTHAFNNSQRFIELPFTQSGDIVSATMPANPRLAPLGDYHLLVLDAAGVPSRSVLVGLGLSGSTPVPVPALTRGQSYALRSVGSPGLVLGRDAAGQVNTLAVSDAAAAPAQAQFIVRNGLGDAACVSLEAKDAAGSWLRQLNRRLGMAANDGSASFAQDATFCPEQAPGARGLVLRSKSYPGYLLRHRAGEAWLDLEAPDAAFVGSSALEAVPVSGVTNRPPTLSVTAPAAGSVISAGSAVAVSSRPADVDGSVRRVEFYDGSTLIGAATASPWTVTWRPTQAGTRALTARGFDNLGASTVSRVVSVTVVASGTTNSPPRLSVTAPAAGSSVAAGVPVTVSSRPADTDGYVRRVEFYDGANLIGVATASPWSVTWTSSVVGAHDLTARGFDNQGASTVSASITVFRTAAP